MCIPVDAFELFGWEVWIAFGREIKNGFEIKENWELKEFKKL